MRHSHLNSHPFLRCLKAALLGLFLVWGLAPTQAADPSGSRAEPPNIIFIMADDSRFDALGALGHPFFKSPNLDRIAHEGAILKNYFVVTPLCSPSRATILTSQYAHQHGIIDNGWVVDRDEQSFRLRTVGADLQHTGYNTAYIGKWHMGDSPKPRQGWDHWVVMPGHGQYMDCPLNQNGVDTKPKGYLTDVLTDFALDYIRQPHEKPFLLFLAHKAWHEPFEPAERHKNLYAGERIVRAPSALDDYEGNPVLRNRRHLMKPSQAAQPDAMILNQLRAIQAIDDGVGRILKLLEETGQLDRTIIIYTADNGYLWGEYALCDKRVAYDPSIRAPMVIRYPKLIKAGTVVSQLTLNLDLAPTFMELAGAPIPPTYQGKSWLPLFRQNPAPWRSDFLAEYFIEQNHPYIPSWQAVRTEDWKYIHYPEVKNSDELYNLRSDPYEMKNVIAEPEGKQRLAQLRARLTELEAATQRAR